MAQKINVSCFSSLMELTVVDKVTVVAVKVSSSCSCCRDGSTGSVNNCYRCWNDRNSIKSLLKLIDWSNTLLFFSNSCTRCGPTFLHSLTHPGISPVKGPPIHIQWIVGYSRQRPAFKMKQFHASKAYYCSPPSGDAILHIVTTQHWTK